MLRPRLTNSIRSAPSSLSLCVRVLKVSVVKFWDPPEREKPQALPGTLGEGNLRSVIKIRGGTTMKCAGGEHAMLCHETWITVAPLLVITLWPWTCDPELLKRGSYIRAVTLFSLGEERGCRITEGLFQIPSPLPSKMTCQNQAEKAHHPDPGHCPPPQHIPSHQVGVPLRVTQDGLQVRTRTCYGIA